MGLDTSRILTLVDHRLISCEKCGKKMRVPINKGVLKVTCANCGNVFTTAK
ncbi:hypothetical protein MASR2M70_07150 [Bacillota bacterium]